MLLNNIDAVLRFALRPWHAHMRKIDLAVLWPACREQTPDLDHARWAFAWHCFRDPAWQVLGEEEIMRRIDNLS